MARNSRLDPATIPAWSDEKLIDYWVDALFERYPMDGDQPYDAYLASLPQPLHDAYVAFLVWSQAGNGGFTQYFWNCGGVVADRALVSFTRMGWGASATVLQRIIQRYAENKSQFAAAQQQSDAFNKAGDQAASSKVFGSLCKARVFEDIESDAFEAIELEFYEKWPTLVREHSNALQQ